MDIGPETSLVYLKHRTSRPSKKQCLDRWGTLDLLDILKDADFLTGFTSEFTSVATREAIPPDIGTAAAGGDN